MVESMILAGSDGSSQRQHQRAQLGRGGSTGRGGRPIRVFTFRRNCSNHLRPFGPTRSSNLSMISSGVYARSKPPVGSTSHRMTRARLTMP